MRSGRLDMTGITLRRSYWTSITGRRDFQILNVLLNVLTYGVPNGHRAQSLSPIFQYLLIIPLTYVQSRRCNRCSSQKRCGCSTQVVQVVEQPIVCRSPSPVQYRVASPCHQITTGGGGCSAHQHVQPTSNREFLVEQGTPVYILLQNCFLMCFLSIFCFCPP